MMDGLTVCDAWEDSESVGETSVSVFCEVSISDVTGGLFMVKDWLLGGNGRGESVMPIGPNVRLGIPVVVIGLVDWMGFVMLVMVMTEVSGSVALVVVVSIVVVIGLVNEVKSVDSSEELKSLELLSCEEDDWSLD